MPAIDESLPVLEDDDEDIEEDEDVEVVRQSGTV